MWLGKTVWQLFTYISPTKVHTSWFSQQSHTGDHPILSIITINCHHKCSKEGGGGGGGIAIGHTAVIVEIITKSINFTKPCAFTHDRFTKDTFINQENEEKSWISKGQGKTKLRTCNKRQAVWPYLNRICQVLGEFPPSDPDEEVSLSESATNFCKWEKEPIKLQQIIAFTTTLYAAKLETHHSTTWRRSRITARAAWTTRPTSIVHLFFHLNRWWCWTNPVIYSQKGKSKSTNFNLPIESITINWNYTSPSNPYLFWFLYAPLSQQVLESASKRK